VANLSAKIEASYNFSTYQVVYSAAAIISWSEQQDTTTKKDLLAPPPFHWLIPLVMIMAIGGILYIKTRENKH
jgi:hypothetical protein